MALSKDLDQFILNGVEGLNDRREKGRGCYGAVYEVRINGVPCIAKRLHDILVGRGQEQPVSTADRRAAIRRFREECVLLSGLRHPNIVQMLGVHYGGSDEADISLIMEYMHMDLEHCMKTYPDIPLPYKTSILRDVAYGLAHLHSLNIIHRDLNAGNVLLTESLRAKIADLGVAKLLGRETAMIRTRTVCPGALDFMSPESLEESPKYDVRLDMFSFGHLAIYLVNQKPPHTLDSTVTVEDFLKKQMQVGKRRRALDEMGGSRHPLYSTVVQCLSDIPDQRPTSRDLVRRMEEICRQHPIPHENTLHMLVELTEKQKFEIELKNELVTKNTELIELKEELNDHLTELNEKLVRRDHQLTESRKETATKNSQLIDLREEAGIKNCQLTVLREELRQKNLQSQQLGSRVRHLESELNATSHTATKLSKEAEQLGAKLRSLAKVEVTFDQVLQGAGQPSPPLPNVRVIPNLSVDVLLLMPKLPYISVPGVQYLAIEGKVFVFGDSQEGCAEAFTEAYRKVLQTLKSTEIPVRAEYPQEKVIGTVASYNQRYNQCHFSFNEQNNTIKIISASSRQFEQSKGFLMDTFCRPPVKTIEEFTFANGRTLTVKMGDIVEEKCSVIVNAANSQLNHGQGVADALNVASNGELQRHSDMYIAHCGTVPVGNVAQTMAGGRLKCKFILHAVVPNTSEPGMNEQKWCQLTRQVTTNTLQAAQRLNAASIVFPPLINTIYRVGYRTAANAMINAIKEFKYLKPTALTDIRIVITDTPTHTWFAQEVAMRREAESSKGYH